MEQTKQLAEKIFELYIYISPEWSSFQYSLSI